MFYIAVEYESSHGHQLNDLIVSATFNNRKIDVSEKNFQLVINPYYGNCFTFNMNNTQYVQQEGYGSGEWCIYIYT